MCPMMMDPQTTRISVSDTSDGVALVFTTSDDVAALREHVHRMAEMHEYKRGMQAQGMGGRGMGGRGMGDRGMGPMVPSHASVEDVPHGARLVLVPDDPAELGALRQHARVHAERMATGRCPMLDYPEREAGMGRAARPMDGA
jgi:hypothetical protein